MAKPLWFFILLAIGECAGFSQNSQQNDFKKLTLEELLDVDVTSVSRQAQPLGETAAAVSVITAEDIRRTGVTSIEEALRLVPGMQVARINASAWAISSRGFNSQLADKMLVLIDGRTVYSPIFAGVFWDVQDLALDDIARIEVVRGPGATLWGTNAVNGIVSIITKTSYQTQNTAIIATGGGEETLGIGTVRTGGAINADTSYRVYAKYSYLNHLVLPDGASAHDPSRFGRSGFRVDRSKGRDELIVMGEGYRGFEGLQVPPDGKLHGGDVLGRWTHEISNTSSIQVQASYERYFRRVLPETDFHQRIFDLDLQHQFSLGKHNLTWGAGYRWNNDDTIPVPDLQFVPRRRTYPIETAFIQDEMSFSKDRLKLWMGSKFEHNVFSGFEVQPSIRASFAIQPDKFAWGAVSRAVRTPTRFDSDSVILAGAVPLFGNPDFISEDLVAFEFGYRSKIGRRLSTDVATFFNIYDNLRSAELIPSLQPIAVFANNLTAKTYGGELSASYDAFDWLRVSAGYAYLGKHLRFKPGHTDVFGSILEGNDPKHQFFIRAAADLKHQLELDSTLRFVDHLPFQPVPYYFELDSRLGWNPTTRLELSLIGRNLLQDRHLEFDQATPPIEEVQRNIFGRIALRF